MKEKSLNATWKAWPGPTSVFDCSFEVFLTLYEVVSFYSARNQVVLRPENPLSPPTLSQQERGMWSKNFVLCKSTLNICFKKLFFWLEEEFCLWTLAVVHPHSPSKLELAIETNFCICNLKSSKNTNLSQVLTSLVPADWLNFLPWFLSIFFFQKLELFLQTSFFHFNLSHDNCTP